MEMDLSYLYNYKVMRIMKLAKYRLKAQVEKDEGQSPRVEKDEGPSGEG